MTDRRTRLRLGGFVALALGCLAALIVLFGGTPRVFSTRTSYLITFPEAPGIGVGTPVRKSGVRVGEVNRVNLDDETGEVQIGIEINGAFRPRETDEATITRGFLSGDTTLDFVPKAEVGVSTTVGDRIPPGATIVGVPPISTRTLLKGAQDVLPTAQENIARVVATIQRFEQAVPRVEKAADEIADLARGGREFVPELRTTNLKVQELIGTTAQPVDEPVTVRQALKEIIDLLQSIRPAADDLRTLLRDNGPEVTKTLESIRRTSDNLNDVLNADNKRNVADTLRNTKAATDDLVRTIRLAGLVADQAEKTVRSVNERLGQGQEILNGAGRVIANAERATQPIAEAAPGVVRNADIAVRNVAVAADQANRALAEIRTLVGGATQGGGSLQKVLTDPTLFNNLNDTVVNVNRVIARLDKVARDLEVFADKVARRPESLGVSGIVRPNSGLKDGPPDQPSAGPLPLAPGMSGPTGLTPIPPVPFGSSTQAPEPVTVRKVPTPGGDLPPRPQD